MSIFKVLLLAIVVILPLTVTADAQKEETVKDEMKKLQGVWQVTKWFEDGEINAPADELKGLTFEFKGDQVIKSDRKDGPPKYVLDPAKKPKWFDFHFGTEVIKGIYRLDGDELTLCIIGGSSGDKASERPTEFKANEKKHHVMFVMKKIKK